MKGDCNIRAVNPKELTDEQIYRLAEVSQDMWAGNEGLGELAQCKCCGKMMSKQDIFGHLEKEVYYDTVKQIMNILGITEIPCIDCGGETQLVYEVDKTARDIRERLLNSLEYFLVVCENVEGEIVGYEEGYVDTLDNIFRRELAYHYSDIGVVEIGRRIELILGYVPNTMLVMSSIGLLNKYSSFKLLFSLLSTFSKTIPDKYLNINGITELDERNTMDFIGKTTGGISLGIQNDPNFKEKIKNTGNGYKSNLTLVPDVVKKYKYFFTLSIKDFLRLSKK